MSGADSHIQNMLSIEALEKFKETDFADVFLDGIYETNPPKREFKKWKEKDNAWI